MSVQKIFAFSITFFSVASLFLSHSVRAQDLTPRPNALPDQSCAMETQDLYERPARITDVSLLYSQHCLNTDRRRAPQLFPDDVFYGLTPVTNIRHRNEYWIAYLPLDNENEIESINFLILRTKTVVVYTGHGQLEIIFKHPITLRSQTDFNKTERVSKIYYSVEAAVPVGIKEAGFSNMMIELLSLKRGMYPLVGRLATEWQRQLEDQKIFWDYARYPMKFQPGEKALFLKTSLSEADRFGFSRPFQVLDDSCVATIVRLTDELPRIKAMNLPPFHHRNSNDPGLGVAIHDLQDRGLIGNEAEVITDAVLN
jgi:hypothetical protein